MMLRLLAVLLLAVPVAAQADALIDDVNGMTLGADGQVIHFKALVVGKDGRIVRLIPPGEEPPKPTRKNPGVRYDWRADLNGATVLPGFVDAHVSLMNLGFRALELDLSDTHSLDQAKAKIAAYVAANPDRKWILGGGWDEERWSLGRLPTAADLDAVVGDRPVVLDRADGHAIWVNSQAMRAAGVTAATQAPSGGRIELVSVAPSGVFVDAARDLVMRAVPSPRAVDRDSAFLKAQAMLLAAGITAVDDMHTALADWLSFRRVADGGGIRLRIESYADTIETANMVSGKGPSPWLYNGRLKLVGVAMAADGALGSRGACLKAKYADAPTQGGDCLLTDDQVRNVMSRAAMDGFQVAIEASGDKADAQVLDAIGELSDSYTGDRRWRIEQARVVDPADLPQFGRHGIIAAMAPARQTSDMRTADARLGPDRLAGVDAWHSLLANNAMLAFVSDAPNGDLNPFHGWAAALTRQDANGDPSGGWQPQERIMREQAWRAYTMDAAHAGFAEDEFGRLAPGQRADFIVVDRDPLLAAPSDLRAAKVLQTWIGGEKVWEAK